LRQGGAGNLILGVEQQDALQAGFALFQLRHHLAHPQPGQGAARVGLQCLGKALPRLDLLASLVSLNTLLKDVITVHTYGLYLSALRPSDMRRTQVKKQAK
jgi:hypothetical protein